MQRTHTRILSVLLAAIMVCAMLALASCSGGNKTTDVTGKWALTGGSSGDITLTKEQIQSVMGEITYSFEEGGKLVIAAGGAEAEGTWEQKDATVTISAQGQSMDMTLEGDKLQMKQGDVVATFTRV